MLFTTDKQTLEDLNIFGKYGSDAVYHIFNRTVTRGGAAVLEEMFQYPLTDEKAINRRSGIIQYFAAAGKDFPFPASYFDAIAPYLANTDERSKLTGDAPNIARKISHLVAMDGDTVMIHKGIKALAALLKGMAQFISLLDIAAGHPYRLDKDAIDALLAAPDFAPVLALAGVAKLSQDQLVAYDTLFRFRHRPAIQRLLTYIYQLDVYLSVAKVGAARGFASPKALPKERQVLNLQGVYHPQVKNAVPNNLHISPESNVLFLTGANMAGKSTFMKSLSIALFLAHMGFPVPARVMEFSALDGIYTTINLPDNLGMGASHFYAEVLRVKKMAYELGQGKNLFIVFDELFRGTNVKDAYEATIAITQAFARKRNSLFVISTHIIEAGEVLREKCSNVRFLYLPTRMNGHHPVYTYTLAEGITDDRHGMVIIHNEGILDMLKAGLHKK
ncbi:MutS domain III [Chitinophaga costaii]|uniref:MutS domain III n=1 Tax=Chitinophaga costaii TaxID=1335309 RepID=A0A1C4EGA5_9BACT|nr:DNA mismatch repair protein [Chitinophaga costaii]PUZ23847.1 DNA mismatch repair protein [Chitinophaga costaii]SCC42522.1 MutS domain III [Chitinophaga costaii]